MSTDYSDYLASLGLQILRVDGDEIHAVCPAHEARVGKKDSHPSFGFNTDKGVGNCFSCGWHPTLYALVDWLTDGEGSVPEDLVEKTKITSVQKTLASLTEEKHEAFVDFSIHEWTLWNRFVDIGPRLQARKHLTLEAANAYGVRFDREARTWVMPIRDTKGTLVGWQRKAGGVKAYNEPKNLDKSHYLFGLHTVRDSDRLALVESPLDAVRLFQCGVPAVSSMGAAVSDDQVRLLSRHASMVVLALDDDEVGRSASRKVETMLRKHGTPVLQWDYDAVWRANEWKDPGDCPDDRIISQTWKRTLRLGL